MARPVPSASQPAPRQRPSTQWRRVDKPTMRRRMVMAIAGLQGSGKTTFALTAPGPIAFMNFDEGYEGVIDRFVSQKQIFQTDYLYSKYVQPGNPAATAQACLAMWNQFVADYTDALSWARTVVVDTFDRPWELLRLARFGKSEEIPPFLYRHLNPEFEKLLDMAKDQGDANVILLHKLKREYENVVKNGREVGQPTGRMRWVGYGQIGYLVHADAEMAWTPQEGFTMTIGSKCRQNASLRGTTLDLPQELLTFPEVASLIFEGTDPEDWEV